jgi:hypothetical protein
MAFVRFCFIVPLLFPVAVVFSVSIGVGGCLCPNYSNAVLTTAPSLAFIKTATISASAAEDMTCLRTLLIIKIDRFVSFSDVLWCFPCVESCQMNDTLFLCQGQCCSNLKVL